MKKFALALVASTALVGSVLAESPAFTGFYVGGNADYSNLSVNIKGRDAENGLKFGKGAPGFGLYAGYNWMMGCTLIGAEFGYTFASLKSQFEITEIDADKTARNIAAAGVAAGANGAFDAAARPYARGVGGNYGNLSQLQVDNVGGTDATALALRNALNSLTSVYTFSSSVKRDGYFSLAPRFGFAFTPSTVGYIRLGFNVSRWNAALSMVRTNAAGDQLNTLKVRKTAWSFAPGVGLETALNKHVFLRAEWFYEFGPSLKFSGRLISNDPTSECPLTKKISNNAFKVGVAYKF